jgi:hypothetical protein
MVPFWSTMFLLGQLVDDRGSDIVDLIGDPVCGCFDLRRTDICVAVHQELYSYLLSSEEKSLMTRILILFHNSTVICLATAFSLLSVLGAPESLLRLLPLSMTSVRHNQTPLLHQLRFDIRKPGWNLLKGRERMASRPTCNCQAARCQFSTENRCRGREIRITHTVQIGSPCQ